ncbi:MAG: radical SAM/SPASM domain-containing protein [Candidatus Woesearchaeota archaeon]
MFHIVNIELNRDCNRSCSYCPISKFPEYKESSNLNFKLFSKIVGELSDFGFSGDFCFTGFYEPLMSNNILKCINYVNKNLGKSRIIVYTNGDYLSKEFIDSIISYNVLLIISLHDMTNSKGKIKKLKRIINGKVKTIFKTDISKKKLSSRIGLVNPKIKEKKYFCVNPSLELTIDCEGNILFCPDDFFSKNTFGNIKNSKIFDIWNKKEFKEKRKKVLKGNYAFDSCRECLN